MKKTTLTIFILFLGGCAGYEQWRMEKDLEKMRAEALAKIDVAACEKSGGKVEGLGMFGVPACVTYFKDGGKPCKSSTDCEGNCFSSEEKETGSLITGICERSTRDRFGCFSQVENGRATYSICVD